MSKLSLPTIAIVGRPNVGKSALFNKILGRRLSIVHEECGVTRDRVSVVATWGEHRFSLVDTGGLGLIGSEKADDFFDDLIRQQLHVAIESADRIIFVTDCISGLVSLDEEVARILHESGKAVFVAQNKADNEKLADAGDEMLALGFEHQIPVSCMHSSNIDTLMTAVTAGLPENADDEQADARFKVALVGRPNVGKSTLTNWLLGEERVIVSDVPGTTRDAVDVPVDLPYEEGTLRATLVDTAGLKRKRNLNSPVEFFSSDRTEQAIRRADMILVLLDAVEGVTAQDKRICRLVLDSGKPCMLLANKWDLAGEDIRQRELLAEVRRNLAFIDHAPLLAICAKSGYNVRYIAPKLAEMRDQLEQEVPTALLNQVLRDILLRTPPPGGPSAFKIYYGVYKRQPPTFLLFVNRKSSARANYVRFLEKQLRTAFNLTTLPLSMELIERRPREAGQHSERRPAKKRTASPRGKGRRGRR